MAVLGLLVLAAGAAAWYFVGTVSGRAVLLAQAAQEAVADGPGTEFDGLRVFLCGTGSPLAAPGRAQACVAVTAGSSLYVVDAGAGSHATMQLQQQPTRHLRAVLVTHLHTDHVTGIPDFNLMSWVDGRPAPLEVYGPDGVERLVSGFNEALAPDRSYRVAHHGMRLLPPELGVMVPVRIEPGIVHEGDGLTITAFAVDHSPVEPAFGYRFDYRGRSVVVSGDTNLTENLEQAATGVDLLLHDVLSLPIVRAVEKAALAADRPRVAKIFADIPSYHAHASELGGLAERSGVRMLAVYHYVPPPRNAVMEMVYRSELPDDTILTRDGMAFELPAESTAIRVVEP